jgi:hypothetical protein
MTAMRATGVVRDLPARLVRERPVLVHTETTLTNKQKWTDLSLAHVTRPRNETENKQTPRTLPDTKNNTPNTPPTQPNTQEPLEKHNTNKQNTKTKKPTTPKQKNPTQKNTNTRLGSSPTTVEHQPSTKPQVEMETRHRLALPQYKEPSHSHSLQKKAS